MMQMKRVLSRGALGLLAIVVAATAMIASTAIDAEAQPFACSAAADVKPVFCKGGLPAACNPAALEEGMPVTLTVDLGNDSTFNSFGALTDPPAANSLGFTMRVYYSCTDSTCTTVNTGDFDYVGATCGGSCTFTNSAGNGYGTVDCPVSPGFTFAAGDTASQELCEIELTAKQPPGTGVITALAGDPANDTSNLLIELDEPSNCIANVSGGGQGSTAAAFKSAPPPGDVTYCRHPNPTILKFRYNVDNADYLYSRLAFTTPSKCDPSAHDFSYTLSNTDGTIGTWSLTGAQIQPTGGGRRYQYKDKQAKKNGGIKRLLLDPKDDRICMNFKGFENLSAATLAVMTIDVDVCGASYSLTATWSERKKGWVLPPSAVPPPP